MGDQTANMEPDPGDPALTGAIDDPNRAPVSGFSRVSGPGVFGNSSSGLDVSDSRMSDMSLDEFDLDVRFAPSFFQDGAGRPQIGKAHQAPTLFGDTCPCEEAPQKPTLIGDTCPCEEAPQSPTLVGETCQETCDPKICGVTNPAVCDTRTCELDCQTDTCATCGCNTSETCTEVCANAGAVTFGNDPMGCDDASGGDDTCDGCPPGTGNALCDPEAPEKPPPK
jgi:hypothetical protein